MTKSERIKTKAVQAPKTQAEAEQLLQEIGDLQREVSRIETEMNDELSEIKRNYETEAQPSNQAIEEKFKALHVWAESNKDQLLKARSKTSKLATGEIMWRTNPPSVSVRGGQQAVVDQLKSLEMYEFIRTKEEVNKDAILADPESRERAGAVKGITINQREEFVAKPFESQIERAETIKKEAA